MSNSNQITIVYSVTPGCHGSKVKVNCSRNLEAPMDRYEFSIITKTHEIRLLQLRQERKTESQRLDNLKKGLQAQLTTKADNRKTHAA